MNDIGVAELGDPRTDPAVLLRNRELIAQRLGWPDGALADCLALEAEYPHWVLYWATGIGRERRGYHAEPAGYFWRQPSFVRETAGEVREVFELCPEWQPGSGWAPPGGWRK